MFYKHLAAELAASCHPSQLHHMTYVGADGTDSPPAIIYLRRPDRAGRQIGDCLVEGSRSKSPPSRGEPLWTGAESKSFIKFLFPGN